MMSDYPLENLMCHRDNLENVLDNLKEGIIAHDMDRRIFFFNTEAERITGYRREDVLGLDCHEAFGSPFCGERCVFCENPPKLADKSEYTLNKIGIHAEHQHQKRRAATHRDDGNQHAGC
jgi:PAS domain-containing protein